MVPGSLAEHALRVLVAVGVRHAQVAERTVFLRRRGADPMTHSPPPPIPDPPLDDAGLRRLLRRRCDAAGGVRALAREWGVSVSIVIETLSGKRRVAGRVLRGLGYERVEILIP